MTMQAQIDKIVAKVDGFSVARTRFDFFLPLLLWWCRWLTHCYWNLSWTGRRKCRHRLSSSRRR